MFSEVFENIENLTQGEKSQLHQCVDFPQFFVSMTSYEYSTSFDTYIYCIYVGIQCNNTSVSIRKLTKRYSEISEFWCKVCNKYEILNTETFPPKIWFDKNNINKIKNRFEQMKKCLSLLCKVPGITESQEFIKFIER